MAGQIADKRAELYVCNLVCGSKGTYTKKKRGQAGRERENEQGGWVGRVEGQGPEPQSWMDPELQTKGLFKPAPDRPDTQTPVPSRFWLHVFPAVWSSSPAIFLPSARRPENICRRLDASESRHVMFPTLLDPFPGFQAYSVTKPASASQCQPANHSPYSAPCRPSYKANQQNRQAKRKREATVPLAVGPQQSGDHIPTDTPSSWRARQFKPLFPVTISILFFRIDLTCLTPKSPNSPLVTQSITQLYSRGLFSLFRCPVQAHHFSPVVGGCCHAHFPISHFLPSSQMRATLVDRQRAQR